MVTRVAVLIRIAGHDAKMETIGPVAAPLGDIAPQLRNIAIRLGFVLAAAIIRTSVAADLAQPQAGGLLLAQGIDIVSLTEAIVQRHVEQGVRRLHVAGIRLTFRANIRGMRLIATAIVWRVSAIIRIDRIDRIYRRFPVVGQVPVTGITTLPTCQGVVVGAGNNTSFLSELTGRVSTDGNHFNTIQGFRAAAADIGHRHLGGAAGIALHHQLVGERVIAAELGVEVQRTAVTGIIPHDMQRVTCRRCARRADVDHSAVTQVLTDGKGMACARACIKRANGQRTAVVHIAGRTAKAAKLRALRHIHGGGSQDDIIAVAAQLQTAGIEVGGTGVLRGVGGHRDQTGTVFVHIAAAGKAIAQQALYAFVQRQQTVIHDCRRAQTGNVVQFHRGAVGDGRCRVHLRIRAINRQGAAVNRQRPVPGQPAVHGTAIGSGQTAAIKVGIRPGIGIQQANALAMAIQVDGGIRRLMQFRCLPQYVVIVRQ